MNLAPREGFYDSQREACHVGHSPERSQVTKLWCLLQQALRGLSQVRWRGAVVVVGHKAAQSLEGLVLLENNHLNFRWSIDLKGKEMEQQGFFLRHIYLGIL